MMRTTFWRLVLALWFLAPACGAEAQEHVPGEVLVRWKAGVKPTARTDALGAVGATPLARYDFIAVERLAITGTSVEDAVARLSADPRVEYAEPNYILSADRAPDDERYDEQWAMRNAGQTGGLVGADISAERAWETYTGEPALRIGVIDTGVDYDHPDLAANIWTNPGEIPANGVDDDRNGYVDDVHGYDFFNHDGDPRDDNGHGTHTAGTIAAVGNNGIGVAGVLWRAQLVPIKFLGASAFGPTSGAVEALQYAIRVGVRLTSNSWGGGFYSRALEDAVIAAGAAGQLVVAAAGNARSNTDVIATYPASLPEDNIISVAATDQGDQLASYSNYGATTVDLAAPGSDILSTYPGGGYRLLSGTSMATPHVAGAAAFLMGRFPGLSPAGVKARLLQLVTPLTGLAGRCVSGGRLNLWLAASDPDSLAPGALTGFRVALAGSNTVDLAFLATGDDSTSGTATRYDVRVALAPFDTSDIASVPGVPVPAPAPAGSAESVRVRGLGTGTPYWIAARALDEFGNPGPWSDVLAFTTLPPPVLTLSSVSVTSRAATGEVAFGDVLVANESAGTLEWTAPAAVVDVGNASAVWPAESGGKGEEPAPGDPQTAASGGPDAFGYRWLDSREADGPSFAWADPTGAEVVPLTGDEATSAPVELGFSFPFYGHRFTRVRVSSNGYLQFGTEQPVFVNSRLPTAGGARNLVAPFWDDLNLGTATDKVSVRRDGTRTVFTWSAVPRYNDAGSVMTFQCLLYRSGEIRFQYLSVTGNVASCTVGIQDSSRTVGLQVAFNQPFLTDSLAVRLVPLPQWLSVTPASGFLAPGERQTLRLRFDPAGLPSGSYHGRARLVSNDPAAPDTSIAATFTVDGAPSLVLSPAGLEFGTHFVGTRDTLTATLSNVGVDPLVVSAVTLEGGEFAASLTPFTLLPGEALPVTVEFAPVSIAEHLGALRFASNDPHAPLAALALHGVGSAAPVIEVPVSALGAAAAPALRADAAVVERPLVLRNTGGAPLEWSATTFQGQVGLAPATRPAAEPAPIAQVKGAVAPGAPALGSGGPDDAGYRWTDSDARGGPVFEWTELAGIGKRLFGGADDSTTRIALPFPFAFYGEVYDSVSVCTNGWLSFVSRDSALVNTLLPNDAPGVPRALVAPLWADFDFRPVRGIGRIYAHDDGSRFIVEWKDAVHFSGAGPYTFQAILWPNGAIEFQYLAIGPIVSLGTVGIQDASGSIGLMPSFNAAYAHPGLRVRFSQKDDWLKLDRTAGTLAPGASDTLRVSFDARDYRDGDYAGEVRFTSNDVHQPLLVVPCGLHVGVRAEAGEAHPAVVGPVSQAPLVRFTVTPPLAESVIDPASLRLNGVPVAPKGDIVHEADGRATLAFGAYDLLGALAAGDSLAVTLTGEYEPGGWFAFRSQLSVTPPTLAGGPLAPFGSTRPVQVYRGNEAVSVGWSIPTGGADHYEVAYSGDGGVRWATVSVTGQPRVAFIPPDTTTRAMVEVLARRGDDVVATWLSAVFQVDLEVVGVPARLPVRFALRLRSASPARGASALELDLPRAAQTRVEVFDVSGARVRTLVHGALAAGRHSVAWEGRRDNGASAPPGLYLVRAQAAGATANLRLVRLE